MKILSNAEYDKLITDSIINRKYEALAYVISNLPRGIEIRSVQPRQLGNNFAAHYVTSSFMTPDYYGKTLGGALFNLITSEPKLEWLYDSLDQWTLEELNDEEMVE